MTVVRSPRQVRLFGSKTCVEQGAKLLTSLQARGWGVGGALGIDPKCPP